MTALYTWPTTLPQVVQKGYTESIGQNVLRTPMDAGPAKMRRRSNKPSTLSVSFLMTDAHIAILQDFIINAIQGVMRFNFTHPRLKTSVEVRLVPQSDGNYFTMSYLGPGYWNVPLVFEVLP